MDRGFPKNIWAVKEPDMPLEAILENAGNGEYHGYPMKADDPFRAVRAVVLETWKERR